MKAKRLFNTEDIQLLKGSIKEILVDSPDNKGFTITLVREDGQHNTFPDNISLGEALGFAMALGDLIGLPDESVRISAAAIERNRLNDLDAMRISKHLSTKVAD